MVKKAESRIAVVGAGAVGSLLGGLLSRQGEAVTIIARKVHADAINKKGLFVDGVVGSFRIDINATEKLDFRPVLVLLTVKTQDVKRACEEIKPHIEGTPVVTMQNGIRSEEIAASCLGKKNVLSGIVLFNAWYSQPGRTTYGVPGGLLVGEAFGDNADRVEGIRALLNKAVKTEICGNIHGARWTKLLTSAMSNSLEALTGLSLKACMQYAILRRVRVLLLKEGLAVVEQAGIQLESLPGFSVARLKAIARAPVPIAATVLRLTMSAADTLTSTLQSIRRGRPTEIAYLNGEIVNLGWKVGAETPYNATVTTLIAEVEKTHQFYSPSDLARYFSSC